MDGTFWAEVTLDSETGESSSPAVFTVDTAKAVGGGDAKELESETHTEVRYVHR